MPGVTAGAIVELEIKTSLQRFYTYPNWIFQSGIPTVKSELFVTGKNGFSADVGGVHTPQYKHNKITGTRHWWVENVPAFDREPMMPHVDLYRSTLNTFYWTNSWTENMKDIWKYGEFGLIITGKSSWNKLAMQAVGDATDPKVKTRKIVEYVKQQMTWDGYYAKYAPYIDEALKDKKGDAADLNIFMITLMRKADLEVNPVFISTRSNGAYHEHFETMEQFNYVIGQVIVGKDTIFVDATDRTLPYNVLPMACLNERGLAVTKKDAKWVNVKPRAKSKMTIESNFTIDEDGTLSGTTAKKAEGYAASNWRTNYTHDTKNFVESLIDKGATVESHEAVNADNLDQPFTINYKLNTNSHVTSAGNFLYISPFAVTDTTTLYKSTARKYPIDFVVPREQVMIFNLTVPGGYVVDQLPEAKVISMSGNAAKATFSFSNNGKQIQALSRVMINRTFFGAEEYQNLKDFYQRIVARQADQIVLKKQ